MKVNLNKEIQKSSSLSHLILSCMSRTFGVDEKFHEFIESKKVEGDYVFDVKLTVDDTEVDLNGFIEHWQQQVKQAIEEKAREFVADKFADVYYILNDLENRIKPEIEKRLEDWEKEEQQN